MASTGSGQHGEAGAARPDPDESIDTPSPQAGSAAAAASDADSGVDPADAGQLAEMLDEARTEIGSLREQFLRASAEAENVRRRAEQEISKARKFAIEGFAAELLAVKDSLELAAGVELEAGTDDAVRSMHEGLALTLRQLDAAFEKFGIAGIDPARGDKLDPELHQAMSVQESDEVAPNHIVQVIQKGFTLNDRLLRPAMVIVARAPAAS